MIDRDIWSDVFASFPWASKIFSSRLSITCLHLAVKFHESGEKLSIYTSMDMSLGFFAMDDFEDAELDILDALEWRLSSDEISVALCNGIMLSGVAGGDSRWRI